MKKLLFVVLLFITGCSASIDNWEVEKAVNACKDNGGVDYISIINSRAICSNGNVYSLYQEYQK